jgi:glucose/mannose-6-phosphate isomerase
MLDNPEQILKSDNKGALKATQMLHQQCLQAWNDTKDIELPGNYQKLNNIVVAGMGGSHLGAQVIKAVYQKSLKIPLIIQNEYDAPGYINNNSLVLATSYSGNTEEILSFTRQAKEKKAKIICISSGGKLAQFADENSLPRYIFESKYNPSKIPRYGSGYLFIAQMAFISKTGAIDFKQSDLEAIINCLKKHNESCAISKKTSENPAKQLAKSCKDKSVILIASEHLTGSAYIFKNQINESAKNFSALFKIPELNHHLLEGLAHPKENKNILQFVFFESDLYHQRNQKRYAITQEVVAKQEIGSAVFKPQSETRLTQAFETIACTSFASLYLSLINKVDPGPNPWVDFFKKKLRK